MTTGVFGKRHSRYSDRETVWIGKKGFPENRDAVARIHAVQIFVERADQNRTPKTIDRFLCLLLPPQPIQH